MARFRNTVTNRVVEIPDTPPDLEKIKHPDPAQQKALRDLRNKKYALTRRKYDESARWERVADSTPLRKPDDPTATIVANPTANDNGGSERPNDSAKKGEWVDYVEALGGEAGDKTIDELKAAADELEQA